MRLFLLALAGALTLAAQQPSHTAAGDPVRQSEAPADISYQTAAKLDSATVNYFCYAPSRRPSALTLTVSDITAANPGAATITGHGFNANATILVQVTGGTGDWEAVNGLRILTYSDANTMTIGVNTTGFDDFTDDMQVLTVTTVAVRESDTLWAIRKMVFDGSGNFVWSGWASAAASTSQVNSNINLTGGRPQFLFACTDRASLGYQ